MKNSEKICLQAIGVTAPCTKRHHSVQIPQPLFFHNKTGKLDAAPLIPPRLEDQPGTTWHVTGYFIMR